MTGTISANPEPGSGPGGISGPLPFLAVRNSYDAAGRLVKVETGTLAAWQSESVAPSAWPGFTIDRTAEALYDAMGRKLRDTLREGAAGPIRSVTQTGYDAFGRPDCTAVRMNPADFPGSGSGASGSPPASACAQGTGGADRVSRNVYDAAGQRLQVRVGVGTSVEGAQATWAYDANGQVTTMIDGNGNRAELHYDGHGRQDRWTFPSATRAAAYDDATPATALASAGAVNAADYEAYAYDANGNRTSLRKRDGRHIAFAYDALGRVTAKTYPDGGATAVHYGYDLRNLQLYARFGGPTGEGVTSSYDGFGRLASSTLLMDGTARTLSYGWDRNANRTRLVHPDGPAFATLYDGLNRPYWMGTEGVNGIASVVYLPHGQPLALNRLGASLAFDYDGVQRQVVRGFLFPAAASNVTWIHAYNPAGGIASETRHGDDYAWTGAYNATRPYATNGLNQYATTGQPNTAGSVAFTYDANGNLTSETPWGGATTSYSYDIENRLIARSGGVTLRYDPLGRLYEVTGASGTTRFLYDGDALVAEYDATGATLRRHAHWPGADVPMTTYEGSGFGTVRQLFADRQGSIAAIADHNGVRLAVNSYDEYGIPGAGNTGRFQYTGQIWLAELGMYHYKARIYSPTLGRFLQTDPIGYEDQYNLYAYVGNDPINASDPSGMAQCTGSHISCPDGGVAPTFSGSPTFMYTHDADGGGGGDQATGNPFPRRPPPRSEGRGPHSFRFFAPGCYENQYGCTLDRVFEVWRTVSAPGAPYAQAREGGTYVTLYGGNPIRQHVNVRERTIINKTQPGHRYHPGTITIQTARRNGMIGAWITGIGATGAHARENNFWGPIIFGALGVTVWARVNPDPWGYGP